MSTHQLLSDLTSRDVQRIRHATWEIIKRRHDRSFIASFVEHIENIRNATEGLEMGGMIAPNRRFVDCCLKVLEFHRDEIGCTCILNRELECFDPTDEEKQGNIAITNTVYCDNSNYVDYYMVECKNCSRKFKVTEGDYHYRYWNWQPLGN